MTEEIIYIIIYVTICSRKFYNDFTFGIISNSIISHCFIMSSENWPEFLQWNCNFPCKYYKNNNHLTPFFHLFRIKQKNVHFHWNIFEKGQKRQSLVNCIENFVCIFFSKCLKSIKKYKKNNFFYKFDWNPKKQFLTSIKHEF